MKGIFCDIFNCKLRRMECVCFSRWISCSSDCQFQGSSVVLTQILEAMVAVLVFTEISVLRKACCRTGAVRSLYK